ncbi:hypothetical protein OC835_001043 [Tilletia horrida]|nr:hypothetical protein OC835_001043 [Tilletia horrida]
MCDSGARHARFASGEELPLPLLPPQACSSSAAAAVGANAVGAAAVVGAGASGAHFLQQASSTPPSLPPAATGAAPPGSHTGSLMDDHLHHLHHHPTLFHSLSHHGSSVLAIAVDESAHIAYSASQSECIVVWDLLTLQERTRLKGHSASVLALELALDKGWLFSSSGDNTVRIWDIHSHQPVAVLYPAEDNVGDIFSLQWSQQLQTLYVGCQNTSIQWISLESVPASTAMRVPAKPHKFFDSVPVALRRRRQREEAHSMYAASSNMGSPSSQQDATTTLTSLPGAQNLAISRSQDSHRSATGASYSPDTGLSGQQDDSEFLEEEENVVHLQFSSNCIVPFAHFGYVYSLLLFYPDHPDAGAWPRHPYNASEEDEEQEELARDEADTKVLPILVSASGDEHIKLWNCQPDGSLQLRATLHNPDSDAGGVLTLAHRPNTLLAGTQGGTIDVWDLETLTNVRTLSAHADDVLSLSSIQVGDEHFCFSSGADGEVRRWDGQFWCTAAWRAHEGLALACVPLRLGSGSTRVITGGSDDLVKLWDFPLFGSPTGSSYGGQGSSPAFQSLHSSSNLGLLGGGGSGAGGGPWPLTSSSSNPYLRRTGSSASMSGLSNAFSFANMRASLLSTSTSSLRTHTQQQLQQQPQESDVLLSTLARFVAFRSVSSDETYREECRQCAHWLKSCLTQLGAETMLLPVASRRNPLVLATFRGKARNDSAAGEAASATTAEQRKKRCLFYGHYDVVDDESGAVGRGEGHHHHHHHHHHHFQQHRPLLSGPGSLPRSHSATSTAGISSSLGGSPANRPRGGSGSFAPGGGAGGSGSGSLQPPFNSGSPGTAPAPAPSDPWNLTGRDGYLYGRGASDNKGPILAVACAAAELLARRELEMDVVMLIEGEEEVGSGGLAEAVRKASAQIGPIDVILLSNSYWLGEDTPCITMGLRGVIHATIEMHGPDKDVHSGVEGGALREPMIDMVRLLSTLSDGDEVLIPNFYDAVRPVSEEDRSKFAAIAKMERRGQRRVQPSPSPAPTQSARLPSPSQTSTESLIARWCRPSLSVHRVGVSGSGNATVIPSKVEAAVSLRIVPDMDAERVGRAFEAHVQAQFGRLRSSNRASVRIDHRADWWLGSETSAYSQALADAIEAEWGEAPVSIREGGSIPAMALLEKELDAPAVHLPMGQSSDNAHLPGERIRLMNLQRGRAVVRRFLEALPGIA